MHIHLDPPSGMAGDMILAALVDAGADEEKIRESLSPLVSGDCVRFENVCRKGITGMQLLPHPERDCRLFERFSELDEILDRLKITPSVKDRVIRMYRSLHEAEAAVHGTSMDAIHLHELAAVDTLVDLTGIAVAVEELKIQSWSVGPIPLGSGTVQTHHGLLPVPAPATLRLLEGFHVVEGRMKGEATTPTAAVVIKEYAPSAGVPEMVMGRTGYGFGTRDDGILPNCLRVFFGDRAHRHSVIQMETNMDDCTGEMAAHLIGGLLKAGALDAYVVPLTMKKGRPGLQLVALFSDELLEKVLGFVFRESTTIGVRYFPVQRSVLERESVRVDLPEGSVSVKVSRHKGEIVNVAPEFDEVAALAKSTGLSIKEVTRTVLERFSLPEEREKA